MTTKKVVKSVRKKKYW